MFCPRCGDLLVNLDGELTCISGNMSLSKKMEALFLAFVNRPIRGSISLLAVAGIALDAELK
jgi:hypothetical protein